MVAFKGTGAKDNLDDWKKNLDFIGYKGEDSDGALRAPNGAHLNVHRGFAKIYLVGLDKVVPQPDSLLEDYADDINNNSKPLHITLTGHSLGGALSLISANDIRRIVRDSGLITRPSRFIIENISFGSPRVYDNESVARVESGMGGPHNILRFADYRDPVPQLPFSITNTKHAGTPIFIGQKSMKFKISEHSMRKNYLLNAPLTFKTLRAGAHYRKYIQTSIIKLKAKLGDSSPNSVDKMDTINNLRNDLYQIQSSYYFFRGLLSDTEDKKEQKSLSFLKT